MGIKTDAEYRAYVTKIDNGYRSAILAGLEFVNWDNYVNKNSRVFIKPNFTFPYYKEGITTSPEFLKCLLELLRGKAGSVIVGESDGGNHSFTADEAFEGHDMPRICKEAGAELVNLSKLPRETVGGEIQGKKVSVRLPRLLLEGIDCFISVPVLKVHAMTGITLSIKNLWGCHPDTMRCLEHQNLSYKLALITRTLKPRIVIIDGTYGLDGHGPMFGEAKKLDLIMVADNPVVADSLGAALMGIPLRLAGHILVAEKAGLGSTSLEQVDINDNWEQYKMQFSVKKTPVDMLSRLLFSSDALAKLVMSSPLTPLIYKVAAVLRTSKEKEVASQLGKQKTIGPY
ncbi:MAG TPA: DUF362 domain-containing protein [Dehalococcoidales bacterium]|nr:DUF362 domain-containing protein [Dehalococcoidales bacterium]